MQDSVSVVGDGEYAVAGDYLLTLQELAAEKGVSPQVLLKDSGVSLDVLIRPVFRVGHLSMARILANLIQAIPDPWLAIEYGRRLTISKHGVLGFAAQSAKSFREAAQLVHQFVNTRSGGGEDLVLVEKDDKVCLRLQAEQNPPDIAVFRFRVLALFVSIETIGRWLAGKSHDQVPTEIAVSAPSPGPVPEGMLSPGLTLHFDQVFNELRCPKELFDVPLLFSNPDLEAAAQKECELEMAQLNLNKNIAWIVRREIRKARGRLPNIERVAENLGMSSRTLKRRLQEAGTSYQKIKDDERFRKAMHLLENSHENLENIAESLGYSDASNFTKAFKNWCDMSPNEFRQRLDR